MAFIDDFKKFAFKGNVVDLAVGVIIGGAFGKIVSQLVADIVMPLVSLILPSGNWREAHAILKEAADPKNNVKLMYGDFLGAVLDFLVIALVLFIIVAKVFQAMEKRLAGEKPPEAPKTKDCPFCFEAINVKATRCKACTSELKPA